MGGPALNGGKAHPPSGRGRHEDGAALRAGQGGSKKYQKKLKILAVKSPQWSRKQFKINLLT